MRGKINVMFYDDVAVEMERCHLDTIAGRYAVNIPIGQWHSLEVLEEGPVIFEAKDGAYKPLSADDIMINVVKYRK